MKIKAGYRTSEFWFTLVSFIFSGLFLLGIIGDYSQKEELIRDISHGVESVILIGGQLFVLYRYVKGRNEIKKIVEEEELEKIKHSPRPSTARKSTKPKTPTPKKPSVSTKPKSRTSTKGNVK
jgi:hypothetical protein